MNIISHRLDGWLFCVAVLWVLQPTWGQRVDTVSLTDGSSVRGTIKRTSKEAVQMETGGGTKTIGANTISYVRFAGEPAALKQARDAVAKGDLESASRALTRAGEADLTRDLVREEFEFVTAELAAQQALTSGEGYGAAAKQVLAFQKSHPDSFHYFQSSETLGRLASALGNYPAAAKFYARLQKSPWPDMQFKGDALLAENLRAQGPEKLEEALAQYERIATADVSGPEVDRQKQIAMLGRAAVAAELGRPGDAEEIEAIINTTDSTDTELMSLAYNALGAHYRAKQQETDAVLAYLHVDLLFAANPAAHAEALFYLSQLWGKLDKPDRGIQAANKLKADYAGSIWAKK